MNKAKQTILIVDDTPENIDILKDLLRDTYNIKAAINGEKALQIVQKNPSIDLILLDIMMPVMNGYEVCRHLKENPLSENIPVIFVTAMSAEEDETKGLDLGAVDYITKPIKPSITKRRIQTQLSLSNQNRELEKKVKDRTVELHETRLQVIQQLGRAAEYRDNETGLHVIRMSHYSRLIAESMSIGENDEWVDLVHNASGMHDIGKIGIPDNILLKAGKLDEDEFKTIQTHSEIGADIIGDHDSELLKMAKLIAMYHHEKYDGSGYPHGLKGEDIPLEARIVAIADVFDALTSERPYKKAWSVEDSVNLIKEQSSIHFDPVIVEHFEVVLPKILKIKDKFHEINI